MSLTLEALEEKVKLILLESKIKYDRLEQYDGFVIAYRKDGLSNMAIKTMMESTEKKQVWFSICGPHSQNHLPTERLQIWFSAAY